jgi:hypothetical protein
MTGRTAGAVLLALQRGDGVPLARFLPEPVVPYTTTDYVQWDLGRTSLTVSSSSEVLRAVSPRPHFVSQ